MTGIFFIINHSVTFAQESLMQIKGTVTDAQTQKPLRGATIYLDNTMMSTVSADNGKFALLNIPKGNYKLIISYVGYNSASVSVNEQSDPDLKVELRPAEKLLDEVAIKINAHWEEYYMLFKSFFLGRGGLECTIQNPKTLFFDYSNSYVLTAEAGRPLIIDNHTLGYKVYYDLTSFVHFAGRTSYSGHTHFEEMKPKDSKEQKKWISNREKAYYGSSNHFMRSLVTRKLEENGFVVKKMVKTDTASANTPVAQRWRGDEFKSSDTIVTMRWNGLDYTPKDTTVLSAGDLRSNVKARYNVLYPGEVPYENLIMLTSSPNNYRFSFHNSLFVTYKKKKSKEDFWGYGNAYKPSFITSILTMLISKTYIDIHGNLADPQAVLNEGYWATLRVADQLPFDYLPELSKTSE